jgi:hypothetical protein
VTAKFRDAVLEIVRVTLSGFRPVVGRSQQEEENMKWETPEYTVIEVCAEATGYFYRR